MKVEQQCLSPGTLILTENGQIKIEDINIGEMIQTHTGELKMVTGVIEFPVPEKLVGIRVTGEHETLILTKSHDIYTIKRDCLTNERGRLRENKKDLAVPDWKCSKHIETLDYLVEPIFIREYLPDYEIDERIAYLLGLYVGDGSFSEKKVFGKKQGSLTIESDVIRPGIYRKMTDNCLDLKWNFSFTFTQKNTFKFTIRNDSFGKLALRLFGTGSHDKFIHPSVFSWSKEQKMAFLGGYIDSDGHFNEAKGHTRITSVNENLMQQTKHLAWSIEIGCTIQRDPIGNTAGGFRKEPGYGYVLNFSRYSSGLLQKHSKKISDNWNFNQVSAGDNFFFRHEGILYIAKKVRSAECIKSSSEIGYNLTVAEDEPFIAGGNIVRNQISKIVTPIPELEQKYSAGV